MFWFSIIAAVRCRWHTLAVGPKSVHPCLFSIFIFKNSIFENPHICPIDVWVEHCMSVCRRVNRWSTSHIGAYHRYGNRRCWQPPVMLNIGMCITVAVITVVLIIGMIISAMITTSMWSYRYVLSIDMISIVVVITCMLNIELASINTCWASIWWASIWWASSC